VAVDEYNFKMPQVEVCDVTGAGDIVCATLAYCIAFNICPEIMIKASVFMGTQSVKHAGSYVLQDNDFYDLRRHLYPSKRITMDEIQFLPRNKKIVFTNGCFDIFHMGHVESLRKSKSFGDILVVGLNSDESISQLKGPERPVMDLDNRLAIIESLEFVDFVIVFNKKTPYDILEALKPDVYVKGAEYRGKYLEGSSYASKIEYIDFETIISTSSIVNKIKNTIYCRPKQEKYII
jgi:D-beta-D-heptose 7-phosphate kinase/D-beta-D-heptose 1-phosphate adenosyltransferase